MKVEHWTTACDVCNVVHEGQAVPHLWFRKGPTDLCDECYSKGWRMTEEGPAWT